MKVSTNGIKPSQKLFHNELIDVYPKTLKLSDISFWKDNQRTVFTFERLCRELNKDISVISIQEITKYVAKQRIHKIEDLSKSIERNGVQVPLIIRDDGKLLDGNRRFFACQWLLIQCGLHQKPIPPVLNEIPTLVIRKEDISETQELKILAEANFVTDLKVSWPLDAQARAVDAYYKEIKNKATGGDDTKAVDEDELIDNVAEVFGIQRSRVNELIGTLYFTEEFINQAGGNYDEKLRRHAIVEEKFVYFWEFINKATKGRSAYTVKEELNEVQEMFFNLMLMGRDSPINNVKQIEPLVQARRNNTAWLMLKESRGDNLSVVVSMINERKAVRKAEDKIRLFLSWLKDERDLTPKAKSYLREVAELATDKSRD